MLSELIHFTERQSMHVQLSSSGEKCNMTCDCTAKEAESECSLVICNLKYICPRGNMKLVTPLIKGEEEG